MRNANDPFFPDGLPVPARQLPSTHELTPARPLADPRSHGRTTVPDVVTLLKALRRHWLLALTLGTLLSTLAGAAAWFALPAPKFTATTVLEVKTQKPVLLMETAQERTDYRMFQATQLAMVKSRLVLNAALGKPGIAELPTIREEPEPADWLEQNIVAEFPAGSELLRLSLSGKRPADLSQILKAVTEAYLEEIVTKDHNERLASRANLRKLYDQYNEKLTKQRSELKKLTEAVGSDDKQTLAMKQQLAAQQLAQEQAELLRVRTELQRARSELSVLQGVAAEQAPAEVDLVAVDEAISRDRVIDQLRSEEASQLKRLDHARRLARNMTDPAVREASDRLAMIRRTRSDREAELRPKITRQLRTQSAGRTAGRVADLDTQVKILSEYEKVLQQQIELQEGSSQAFNRQTIDLQWMKDEIDQGMETARLIGKQIEAYNVELMAPQRVRTMDPPDNPRAESPKKRLMAVGLVMMAVFGGTILAISWFEFRVRRVNSPDEVVEGLGLRLVGTLPALPGPGRNRGREPEGDSPNRPRWQDFLIESIDAARTVLLRDCRSEDIRTVMITSAAKGEGKSSLSSHMAISLARTGRRTLLADFDLRCPSAHRLFAVARGPGICELLRGEADLEEVAQPVMSDLDIIPAGQCDPQAIRALGQETLAELIARFKDHYEFIVIDSAPVLPVADSLVISQHVDAVVLSVYREVSRLPAVQACYERLTTLGVRVLGVVVTGVPVENYGQEYHISAAHGR